MSLKEDSSTDNTPHKPVVGPSGRKIVYDENGKPCRSCNSLLDFKLVMGSSKPKGLENVKTGPLKGAGAISAATITDNSPSPTTANASSSTQDCPPDVEELGRSSWTLLHSIAATYPETPSSTQQADLKQFVKLFGNFYPCWFCAKDFREYSSKNEPKVATQDDFGKWLCDAHNEVNRKLGKKEFDCNLWKQRWKDGWEDGRCN